MKVRGERIRELREERGLSLADFASRAAMSISYLSEIERGTKKPSLKTIDRIAEAFHIPKSQLVDIDVNSPGLTLGDRIRLLREESQLLQGDLSERAGISVSYLSQIENNNVYPALHTLKALAGALKVSVSTLVGRGGALGAKLRRAREEQGLTQAELAKSAGVSPGLVGQVEHGKVQPSLQTVEKLSRVLGTSPCYFIVDDAGLEDVMQMMRPEVRDILADPQVQSVLRMVCDCTDAELRFIIDFIKLFKRFGAATENRVDNIQ